MHAPGDSELHVGHWRLCWSVYVCPQPLSRSSSVYVMKRSWVTPFQRLPECSDVTCEAHAADSGVNVTSRSTSCPDTDPSAQGVIRIRSPSHCACRNSVRVASTSVRKPSSDVVLEAERPIRAIDPLGLPAPAPPASQCSTTALSRWSSPPWTSKQPPAILTARARATRLTVPLPPRILTTPPVMRAAPPKKLAVESTIELP
eukprot:5319725-Prymnesium_polylepis.1